eukprot:761960-Hanusia_phi.AAC.1
MKGRKKRSDEDATEKTSTTRTVFSPPAIHISKAEYGDNNRQRPDRADPAPTRLLPTFPNTNVHPAACAHGRADTKASYEVNERKSAWSWQLDTLRPCFYVSCILVNAPKSVLSRRSRMPESLRLCEVTFMIASKQTWPATWSGSELRMPSAMQASTEPRSAYGHGSGRAWSVGGFQAQGL